MRLEWIAAALNPGDVAPHPNFMSSERITPAGLFALLAQMRIVDFERLTAPEPLGEVGSETTADPRSVEMILVAAARSSLDAESSGRGAERLGELVNSTALDPACRVAATLLASVALSELDRQSAAISLIRRTIAQLPPDDDPDGRLVRAVALQQLALRQLEIGLGGDDEAEQALGLLENLRPSDLSSFEVSKGVRWRSSHTLALVLEELRSVADAHIANVRRSLDGKDWVRFVRAPAPRLGLQLRRRAEEGFSNYVRETYESQTGSTSRTFFSGDPVESGVYATLLHYELLGAAPEARGRRTDLARLRVLRSSVSDRVWSRQDAIRLLRQADDIKSLELALRYTRAGGPLASLSADARQIIDQRLGTGRLRRVELAVLAAGAHLLSQSEAARALNAVLASIEQDAPASSGRWEATSVRLESAWTAAVELAGPAERLDDVAEALLASAGRAAADDELLIRALTRAAMNIEWDGAAQATRDAWARWLLDRASPAAVAMAELVGPQVGLDLEIDSAATAPIERAASLLNRFFRTGASPAVGELVDIEGAVTSHLRRIRDDAGKGHYSFGAISVGDVAVGLALHANLSSLWSPITDFLLDRRVNRDDKAMPLERLAHATDPLPAEVVRAIGAGLDDLLTARSVEPFGEEIVPFPPALRFAAAHSLLSEERLLGQLSRLAGSPRTAGRAEAARTLSLVARLGQDADWGTALALQLTYDPDALVRGESGRSLGALARQSERHLALVEQRLLELLAEDGLVVPLLVLRGLQSDDAAQDIPPAVTRRVTELAVTHPARGVRLQAQALLQSPSSL